MIGAGGYSGCKIGAGGYSGCKIGAGGYSGCEILKKKDNSTEIGEVFLSFTQFERDFWQKKIANLSRQPQKVIPVVKHWPLTQEVLGWNPAVRCLVLSLGETFIYTT